MLDPARCCPPKEEAVVPAVSAATGGLPGVVGHPSNPGGLPEQQTMGYTMGSSSVPPTGIPFVGPTGAPYYMGGPVGLQGVYPQR